MLLLVSAVNVCWGTEGDTNEGSGDEGIMPISAELEEDIDPDVTIIGFSIDDGSGLETVMPQGVAVSCMNEDMHSVSTRPCVKSAKVAETEKYTVSLELRNNSTQNISNTNIYMGLDDRFFAVSENDTYDGIESALVSKTDNVVQLLMLDKNEKLVNFVRGRDINSCGYILNIQKSIPAGETVNVSLELNRASEGGTNTFTIPVLAVSNSEDNLSESVHTAVINVSISQDVELSISPIEITSSISDDEVKSSDTGIDIISADEKLSPFTVKTTIKNTSNSVAQYNKIVFNHYVTVNKSLSLVDFKKEDIGVSYSGEGKDEDTFYVDDSSSEGSTVIYTLYPLDPGEELTVSLTGTPIEDWGIIESYTMSFDVEAEPASLLQGSDRSTSWGKEYAVEDDKLSYKGGSFTSTTKAGINESESNIISMSTIDNPVLKDTYVTADDISDDKSDSPIPTVIGLLLSIIVVAGVAVFLNKTHKEKGDEVTKSKKK